MPTTRFAVTPAHAIPPRLLADDKPTSILAHNAEVDRPLLVEAAHALNFLEPLREMLADAAATLVRGPRSPAEERELLRRIDLLLLQSKT